MALFQVGNLKEDFLEEIVVDQIRRRRVAKRFQVDLERKNGDEGKKEGGPSREKWFASRVHTPHSYRPRRLKQHDECDHG